LRHELAAVVHSRPRAGQAVLCHPAGPGCRCCNSNTGNQAQERTQVARASHCARTPAQHARGGSRHRHGQREYRPRQGNRRPAGTSPFFRALRLDRQLQKGRSRPSLCAAGRRGARTLAGISREVAGPDVGRGISRGKQLHAPCHPAMGRPLCGGISDCAHLLDCARIRADRQPARLFASYRCGTLDVESKEASP
jgi:hypothetical protein